MSKRSMPEGHGERPKKKHHPNSSKNSYNSNRIVVSTPSLNITSPWLSAEIPAELPPLPTILDPETERDAFTHPGLSEGRDYEKLEWLGDAYIELIATNLIFTSFPHIPAGRCNQIREQLVRNITLAEYYRQYGMETRTRLPQDLGTMEQLMRTRPRDKEIIKIQGDIFEAFVAAVIVSDPQNGLVTATNWLRALWGRTILDQVKKAEREREENDRQKAKDQSKGAPASGNAKVLLPKEKLANTLMVKGIRLRYEDEPSSGLKKDRNLGLPLYIIGVYLDGWGETNKFLGVGSALNKKEAGQKAAEMALQNKQLMKLYGDMKLAYQKAQKDAEILNEGQ